MKINSTILLSMAGLLALLNSPGQAQENPVSKPAADTVKEAPPRPSEHHRHDRPPASRQDEQKPVSFVGVLTREVSPETSAQLGLDPGFGLVVEEVMPNSPAKKAGIEEHDILVAFEDQRLVNMQQLMTLVRSRRKDDVVTFTVIRSGKESRMPVTIGEHMDRPSLPIQPRFFGARRPDSDRPGTEGERSDREFPRPDMMMNQWRQQMEQMQRQMREQQERFQQQMREYQERIQNWSQEGNRGPFPQPPLFRGPGMNEPERRPDGDRIRDDHGEPRRGESHETRRSETHQSASVTRSDDSGVYSLRQEDGRMVFTARPKNGEERSWTLTNDQDAGAIPEDLRPKLRELQQIRSEMDHEGPRDRSRPQESPPSPRDGAGDRGKDAHRPRDTDRAPGSEKRPQPDQEPDQPARREGNGSL